MTGVFYHSVIHGLGFFICFKLRILRAENNKTRFHMFYTLIKHGFLTNHAERSLGPIYILMLNTYEYQGVNATLTVSLIYFSVLLTF